MCWDANEVAAVGGVGSTAVVVDRVAVGVVEAIPILDLAGTCLVVALVDCL